MSIVCLLGRRTYAHFPRMFDLPFMPDRFFPDAQPSQLAPCAVAFATAISGGINIAQGTPAGSCLLLLRGGIAVQLGSLAWNGV
jgi:hypothetical protein